MEELGWKRLCPKCEEHYSDPNDLGECPVCETQARNNSLSKMLKEIWDAVEQETGDWRDVGSYFTKLRKERDQAQGNVEHLRNSLYELEERVLQLIRELDEARTVARELDEIHQFDDVMVDERQRLRQKHPWLTKEKR